MAKVEIYTTSSCGFCVRAKRLLDMKRVAYAETSIDRGGEPRAEMMQRANGRSSVPQIFIGGLHIGGCDDLMALEMDGKLDAMLAQ